MGSRHANCPIQSQFVRQQRTAAIMPTLVGLTWNGCYPNTAMSNKWRASLVPAAAVIPAPLAYTNIAAVKTLVVCHRDPGLVEAGWLVTCHCWLGKTSVSMFLVPTQNAEVLLHEALFSEGQSYLAANSCVGNPRTWPCATISTTLAHNWSSALVQPW